MNYSEARWRELLTVNFGLVLCGSSPCNFRRSLVRINLENNVMPVPPPGIGSESFMLLPLSFLLLLKLHSLVVVERRNPIAVLRNTTKGTTKFVYSA